MFDIGMPKTLNACKAKTIQKRRKNERVATLGFPYNVDTVLCQFLETGTSDRCLICIVQLLRFSGFSLYSLSFFLYSPFKHKGSKNPKPLYYLSNI